MSYRPSFLLLCILDTLLDCKQDEWRNALVSRVIARLFWFEISLILYRQGVGYGVVIGGCKTREIDVVLS